MPSSAVDLGHFVSAWAASPLACWSGLAPWQLTTRSVEIARALVDRVAHDDAYAVDGDIAIHRTAIVEAGAVLKGPLVVGPGGLIAAGAYVRGGCWIDENCILGPGAELKSSFMFRNSKLAHFNFVGDSVLGANVNLEAGSIVANYRNERADKQIRVRIVGTLHATGCDKFGALIGDDSRLGANAVVAPGALLPPGTVVRRLALLDQEVEGAR